MVTRATERALRASIQRGEKAFDTLIREGMWRLHAAAVVGLGYTPGRGKAMSCVSPGPAYSRRPTFRNVVF